jgi:hypothetical protein
MRHVFHTLYCTRQILDVPTYPQANGTLARIAPRRSSAEFDRACKSSINITARVYLVFQIRILDAWMCEAKRTSEAKYANEVNPPLIPIGRLVRSLLVVAIHIRDRERPVSNISKSARSTAAVKIINETSFEWKGMVSSTTM